MSKPLLLVIVFLVIVAAGIGVYFLAVKGKTGSSTNSLLNNLSQTITQKEIVKGDKVYSDDSGFSFKYPTGVTVKDITPNDNTYYSLLDVSRGSDSIRVTVKDGTDTTPPAGASLVGATSLAGISAKQYSYKVGGVATLLTIGVDKGIIYMIEGKKDGGFWEDTQNVVASSLSIVGQASASFDNSGGANTVDEGEEVVQ